MITKEKQEWRDAWRPFSDYVPNPGEKILCLDNQGLVWRCFLNNNGDICGPKGESMDYRKMVSWVYLPSRNIQAYYDANICPSVPIEVMHATVCNQLAKVQDEKKALEKRVKQCVSISPEEKLAFEKSLAAERIKVNDQNKEIANLKAKLEIAERECNSYREQLEEAQKSIKLYADASFDYMVQLNNLFEGKEKSDAATRMLCMPTDLYYLRGKEIISERAMKRCHDLKCKTLDDVAQHTEEEFLNLNNCGEMTVSEIKTVLGTVGLKLKS